MVHFTRAAIARPVVEYFDRLGCPAWKYLSRAQLSPALLEDPGALVPVRALHDFAHDAARSQGIDCLGLRLAESVTLDSFGAFGAVLLGSRNVFDYLQKGCRLVPEITSNETFWLQFEKDQVRFCHSEQDVERPLDPHLFVLAITIGTIRRALGEPWIPREITLPVEPEADLAEVSEAFCNARVDTERPHASFTFPAWTLMLPMPRSGPAPSTDGLDFATAQPSDFAESVRRLAETLVLDGHADLPTAAEFTGMSERTLQRRLSECGADFSTLVLEARITRSEKWLRETDRPITDIAHDLGYADSANFTRAFRRVNGLSPRAYREHAFR